MVGSEDLNRPMIHLHVFSLWALVKGILSYSRIYKAFDPFKLSSEATSPLDGLLTDGYRLGVEQVGREGIHWLSKQVVFCTVSLSGVIAFPALHVKTAVVP